MIPTQDLQNNSHLESFGQTSKKSPWESILRMEEELRAHREFIRFMQTESGFAELGAVRKKLELEQGKA